MELILDNTIEEKLYIDEMKLPAVISAIEGVAVLKEKSI
jgi:hypothetical protein